jgi:hypothetical protein
MQEFLEVPAIGNSQLRIFAAYIPFCLRSTQERVVSQSSEQPGGSSYRQKANTLIHRSQATLILPFKSGPNNTRFTLSWDASSVHPICQPTAIAGSMICGHSSIRA